MAFDASLLEPVEQKGFDPSLLEPVDSEESTRVSTPQVAPELHPHEESISEYHPTIRQRAFNLLGEVRRSQPVETILGKTPDETAQMLEPRPTGLVPNVVKAAKDLPAVANLSPADLMSKPTTVSGGINKELLSQVNLGNLAMLTGIGEVWKAANAAKDAPKIAALTKALIGAYFTQQGAKGASELAGKVAGNPSEPSGELGQDIAGIGLNGLMAFAPAGEAILSGRVKPFQRPNDTGSVLKTPTGAVPPVAPSGGGIPFNGIPEELLRDKPAKATVPETHAEDTGINVLEEIRNNGAKTKKDIQRLFPAAQLSNEAAAALRDQAWGKQTPQGGDNNASEISSSTSVPEPEIRTPMGQSSPLRQQGEVAGTQIPEPAAATPLPERPSDVPVVKPSAPIKPKPDWQVTVQSAQDAGGGNTVPGYVQIDDVSGGKNNWSKSPETLAQEGVQVPDFSKLPQGKYTFAEAEKLAKQSPTENTKNVPEPVEEPKAPAQSSAPAKPSAETVKAAPASPAPNVPTIGGTQAKVGGGKATERTELSNDDIYTTQVKDRGEMFAVPSPENLKSGKRGFGDGIFATRAEAEKYVETTNRINKANEEYRAKARLEQEKIQSAKSQKESAVNEYLDALGQNPMQRAKLKNVLLAEVAKNASSGKQYRGNRAEVVRQMVQDGYEPRTEAVQALKEPTRTQFNRMDGKRQADFESRKKEAGTKTEYQLALPDGSNFVVTKAEHDYANWLKSKSESKPTDTPTTATAKISEHVSEVKQTEGVRPAKEVKSELVSRLEKAIEDAPEDSKEITKKRAEYAKDLKDGRNASADARRKELEKLLAAHTNKITIDIPGDGTFTIWNTKQNLGDILKRAQRLDTSATESPTVRYTGTSKADKEWIAANKQTDEPTKIGIGPGAATAGSAEFSGGGSPTAMKYRLIDAERQKRGLPPLAKPEGIADQALMDKAMAEVDKNPALPENLVKELNRKPRAIEAWERMVLLLHKIDLREAYEKSARAAAMAFEDAKDFPNRRTDMVAHNVETARLSDELTALEKASRASGSATGRALRALQIMANEDYSLASLEIQARGAKGGAPLTDAERAGLKKIADDYAKANAELQSHLDTSRRSEAEANRQLDEILKQPKAAPVEPHVRIIADKIKGYFDSRADAALKRLSGKTFSYEAALPDLVDLGVSRILSGATSFAIWSGEMLSRLDKSIEPHLKDLWARSQKALDEHTRKMAGAGTTGEKVKKAVKSMTIDERKTRVAGNIKKKLDAGKKDGISNSVGELARLFVEGGIKDRDALIDAVHGVLSDIDPTITRRDTMDAISGYGDFKQLSKDQVSVTLRDLKRQMQEVAKLEDMALGKPPLKTGMERAEWSKEQARLQKLVNDAKFDFQVPSADPRTQLQSALDTFKKRQQSQIDEFQRRLDEGDYDKKPRRVLELDRKAMELQARKEAVQKKFRSEQAKWELANRDKAVKGFDLLSNIRRFSVLSGVGVLGKLAAYSATKVPTIGVTEAIGSLYSKLPKISQIFSKAPGEGATSLSTLSKSVAKGLTQGFVDAYQIATKGSSSLKDAFSPRLDTGFHWYQIPQLIHEVIKSPLRRIAFEKSLANRMEHAARNGADITDPLTQLALAKDAYLDSDRALLLENNRVATAIRNGFRYLETKQKNGKIPMSGKFIATLGRVEMPILSVPFNYMKQTLEASFGLITGSLKMRQAFKDGIETLKPEEADAIARQLKYGTIGAAMLLYGFFDGYNNGANGTFGGFYEPGEKRKKEQAGVGGIKIGGVNVPSLFLHNPILAVGQLGHTIGAIASQKISKKNPEQRGITAGAVAGMFGLLNDSPVGNTFELVSNLSDPHKTSSALDEHIRSLLIPQLMNEVAKYTDKDSHGNVIKRAPVGLKEHLESSVPGLRQNVPIKK